MTSDLGAGNIRRWLNARCPSPIATSPLTLLGTASYAETNHVRATLLPPATPPEGNKTAAGEP